MFRSPAKEMGEVQWLGWLELSDVAQERHKPRAESEGKGGFIPKAGERPCTVTCWQEAEDGPTEAESRAEWL